MRPITTIRTYLLLAAAAALAACAQQDTTPADQLASAVRNRELAKAKTLINAGAPVNPAAHYAWTPLMQAVMQDDPDMVGMLMDSGADPNARNRDLETPVHLAARWGKTKALRELTAKHAYLEPRDYIGWTPLMWASLRGKDAEAAILLDAGADVNFDDSDGNTPLMLAAWRGHSSTAELLLARGAGPSAKNRFGLDAAGIAGKHGFPELAARLAAKNSRTN